MTLQECAVTLKNMIAHREHMNRNLYAIDADGTKTKIENYNDYFLEALKIALSTVEEKLR